VPAHRYAQSTQSWPERNGASGPDGHQLAHLGRLQTVHVVAALEGSRVNAELIVSMTLMMVTDHEVAGRISQ
jgi:hypothetical protein